MGATTSALGWTILPCKTDFDRKGLLHSWYLDTEYQQNVAFCKLYLTHTTCTLPSNLYYADQLTGITHYSPSKAHVFSVQIFAVMFLLPEMSPSMMQPTILSAELEILASSWSPPSPSPSTCTHKIFKRTQTPLANWWMLWTSPQERANICNILHTILGAFIDSNVYKIGPVLMPTI